MRVKKLAGRIYRRLLRIAGRLHPRRFVHSYRWLQRQVGAIRNRRDEQRLTVGIDIAALWEPLTGVGWYLYQLLVHLADRDDLRLRLYGPTLAPSDDLPDPVVEIPTGPALEMVFYPVRDELVLPSSWVVRILRRVQPLLIAADRNQVMFAPNYFLPRRFSLARGELVITILDLGFRRVPETLREETLAELEANLGRAIERSKLLITISESVRQEIIEDGFATPERVRAIHLGPGHLAGTPVSSDLSDLPEEFALFVGTLEPRKNIETLLTAWTLLREAGVETPQLLICGRFGWKSDAIRARVEAAEAEGWARHLGYVDDQRLAALYAASRFVVFPSLYEGFGFPAVEAMSSGTPVICSDIPVLREVSGNAAIYADPASAEAWADSIRRLVEDPALRDRHAAAGRRQAARFSWDIAATETAEVWREAAGAGSEAS